MTARPQVTFNYPPAVRVAGQWCVVAIPPFKFALMLNPVCVTLEDALLPTRWGGRGRRAASAALRSGVLCAAVAAALWFPYFALVSGFTGAALSMFTSVIFPCACLLKLHRSVLSRFEVAGCVGLIAFGVCVGATGAVLSLVRIAQRAAAGADSV